MMIDFKQLQFCIQNDTIRLVKAGNIAQNPDGIFCEVQVAGFVKDSHLGVKTVNSSEGRKLRYVSHVLTESSLVIVQKSALVEVTTLLFSYDDCDAVHVTNCVKCICPQPIVLEEVSSFVLPGIGAHDTPEQLRFTKFVQSHHAECQPDTRSFDEHGLYRMGTQSQKRIAFSNVGSWSTKEALPQGMIFGDASGSAMMFQIESSNSWYYEIGDLGPTYYLYLGGANATHGAWSKQLSYGEVYTAPSVSLAFGADLNDLLAEMTKCRRHIAGKCKPDADLPSIFNEYMHLSWDSPSADTTRKYAPTVSALGVKYYVIDCGWHNEEDGNIIYPFVGQWKESNKRFPKGVRQTTDYIRSLGMKAGLWIEPEIIGTKCAEMLEYYDDDCFLSRNGKRIGVMNRYFLDYRNPKVIAYMSETIRRMVEDYGADYIKMDFNEDCGIGADRDALTPGEGLESHARAYLAWIDRMRRAFPNVLFETCSSGGMRMDYATLSHFSIVSTSDQTSYLRYPYIAGNVLSAVLPEQAAVWSYPVGTDTPGFTPTKEWVNEHISDEQIIMNMVNSLLGRIHLASHVELLHEGKLALIKEGLDYYDGMTAFKKAAVPYLPLSLTRFGKKQVAAGLLHENKLLLAVWNLGGEREMHIPLADLQPASARVAYPADARGVTCTLDANTLTVHFTEDYQARMLEITLN